MAAGSCPGRFPDAESRLLLPPMAQIREIKKRMVAVGTIQRITKTMQMIATAKFTAALQSAQATKPYTATIGKLVGQLAAAAGDVDHPLINGPSESPKRELILVITSDRGLCGAYNANVLRTSLQHIRSLREAGIEPVVETSGKKAVGFFSFQKIDIAERHSFGDKPSYDELSALGDRLIADFTAGKYDAVRVVYMKFISNSRQVPEVLQLLPLKPEAATEENRGAKALYEFSPTSEELLADLLPLAAKSQFFQSVNDAVVSEQIMRMIAMKAATENARDLKRTLNRDFNRARQAQITTELTEIISGSAALE